MFTVKYKKITVWLTYIIASYFALIALLDLLELLNSIFFSSPSISNILQIFSPFYMLMSYIIGGNPFSSAIFYGIHMFNPVYNPFTNIIATVSGLFTVTMFVLASYFIWKWKWVGLCLGIVITVVGLIGVTTFWFEKSPIYYISFGFSYAVSVCIFVFILVFLVLNRKLFMK